MPNPIRSTLLDFFIERPGRKHTLPGWAAELEKSGTELADAFAAAADTEANRRVISHITGIERWATRRLSAFLGDPLIQEEYDSYRPAQDLDLVAMRAAFIEARAETLAVVNQLVAAAIDDRPKVLHNQYGPLTVRGWMRYLHMHSTWEAKRLKG